MGEDGRLELARLLNPVRRPGMRPRPHPSHHHRSWYAHDSAAHATTDHPGYARRACVGRRSRRSRAEGRRDLLLQDSYGQGSASRCFGARSAIRRLISPSEQLKSDASSRWRSAYWSPSKGTELDSATFQRLGFSLSFTQRIPTSPSRWCGYRHSMALGYAINLACTFQFLVGAYTLTMESTHPHA